MSSLSYCHFTTLVQQQNSYSPGVETEVCRGRALRQKALVLQLERKEVVLNQSEGRQSFLVLCF